MLKRVLILSLMLILPVSLFAATTGKLVGTVVDKESGDALPGANVIIEGTQMGASTDLSGYYTILNVPVGAYNVRVEYIGYQATVQQNIRVSVDHTTEVNFAISPETIQGEEVVIVAERALIRKDETNTNIIKTAEDLQNMPIRGMQAITATVAGVVKQDKSNTLNIRGGRGEESAVYIDGVLANDPYNSAVRAYLPNEAIEEVSVQTGGFSAEYGEAMSGIVLLTTNAGAANYFGSVQGVTDGFLSTKDKTLDTYGYGYNEYVATLGGPIWPGANHTFFVSAARLFAEDGAPSWGWIHNDNKPDQFQTGTIPGQKDASWNFAGKAKFQINKNMELKGSAVWSDRVYGYTGDSFGMNPVWLYNVDHALETATYHHSANVTFTHVVKPTTYYDVKLNWFDTFRETYDRAFGDNFIAYGDPTLVTADSAWANNAENYGNPYNGRLEPDMFKPGGTLDYYAKNKTTYYGGSFDMTHQHGRFHNLRFGADFKYHSMREYSFVINGPSRLATRSDISELEKYRNADVYFYGYDMYGNETNSGSYLDDVVRNAAGTPTSGYNSQEPYHPITWSAYVRDKIEFEDLILNIGLRYDRIDPNAWMFNEIDAREDANGNYIEGSGMFGGNNQFDKSDTKDSESYGFLSPRLGLSFPVDDATVFHAQYGKFYQKPQLQDLYLSPFYLDRYATSGGYFTTMDNPNLRPPKTTAYEVGFKRSFSNNISLQLSAFYKETEELVQVLNRFTDVTNIAFKQNGDFGVVKGFDVIFELRRTNNLAATFNYEYQTANGTGSATNTNFDIAWIGGARGNFPKFIQPLEFEQAHTGTLNLDYRLTNDQGGVVFRNSGANLLFSFNSGRPFTQMFVENALPHTGRYDPDNVSNVPQSAINAGQTPWNFSFDLRLNKTFNIPISDSKLDVYLWVINLLDSKSVNGVWWTTGLPDDTGYLGTSAGKTYYASLTDTEKQNLGMREMDYIFYGVPRQVRLGFNYTF